MANNNDWHTPGAGLTLPFGAGPGTPSIVAAGDASQLPADLVAFYAGFGETVVAGFIFNSATNAYDYQVLVVDGTGRPFMCFGGRDTGLVIGESYRLSESGGFSQLAFGLHGLVNAEFRNGSDFQMLDNGSLVVGDNAILDMQSSAVQLFSNSTFAQYNSGTFASFQAGSNLLLANDTVGKIAGIPIFSGYADKQSVTFVAASFQTATIVFPSAFANVPEVTTQVVSSSGSAVKSTVLVTAVSTSQFSIRVDLSAAASVTISVHWQAVGT